MNKQQWQERIAKFTDDYFDEWWDEGNDLTELHRIQDELIDEIMRDQLSNRSKHD